VEVINKVVCHSVEKSDASQMDHVVLDWIHVGHM